MGALLRPVGPHPAATYWWRRLLLLGVVVVSGVVLLRACGADESPDSAGLVPQSQTQPQPGSTAGEEPRPRASSAKTPRRSPKPSPTGSSSPSATPSPDEPAGPRRCPDSAIEVSTQTDERVYAAAAKPRLVLAVENVSDEPCRRDVGQRALELTITSGEDRIWSSDDCAPGGPRAVRLLRPGRPYAVALTWTPRRSAAGCPGDQPAAQPGTYVLSGRAGDVSGGGAVFALR